MSYIGKAPVNGFHSKQTLSTDGSTTTFTLDFTVADETALIVVVGGVIQEPKSAFNLAGGGTQITFTAAPASTDTAYIQFLGQAIVQNLLDINGAALILDADADTTITADTDDQIDIAIAGADDFQFTANKFSTLSGSNQEFADNSVANFGASNDMTIFHDGTDSLITNKTGAMKIATETSGIAVTIGHTTSETTVADNLTVTGNLTVGGNLTVSGTTTSVNSTTTTLTDPVIELAKDTSSADGLDRGVRFKWHNGSAVKDGFFGFDIQTQRFSFTPDEDLSGGENASAPWGDLNIGDIYGTGATLDNVRVAVTAAGEIDTSSGNLTLDSAGGTVVVDDNLNVTGTVTLTNDLAVTEGGTGVSAFTDNGVLYGDGANALDVTAASSANGSILQADSGGAPAFSNIIDGGTY